MTDRNKLLDLAKEAGFAIRETDFAASTITDVATLERLAALLSAAQGEPAQEWNSLTDADREQVFLSMPGGLDGFLKTWGWLPFAKAIETKCREKNSAPPSSDQVWNEAIEKAKASALFVFKDSCNHTHQAIEYMAAEMQSLKRPSQAQEPTRALVTPDHDGSPCAQCGATETHVCAASVSGAVDELPPLPKRENRPALNQIPYEVFTAAQMHAYALAARSQAAPANNYHDAYRGARDDMQEWKKRALEAEESCRRLTAALNAENGPTHMGEPVLPQEAPAVSTERILELAEEMFGRSRNFSNCFDEPSEHGIIAFVGALLSCPAQAVAPAVSDERYAIVAAALKPFMQDDQSKRIAEAKLAGFNECKEAAASVLDRYQGLVDRAAEIRALTPSNQSQGGDHAE